MAPQGNTSFAERRRPESLSVDEVRRLRLKGKVTRKKVRLGAIKQRLTRFSGEVLSSAEAAFFLCCSRATLSALIRRGEIHAQRAPSPSERYPYVWRIPASEVLAYAARIGAHGDDVHVERIRIGQFEERSGGQR